MKDTICPRCGRGTETEATGRMALSRKDQTTIICNSCGTDEAMINYHLGANADVWPGYPGRMTPPEGPWS